MRIVQATFGTFHHFELAHQLDQRGHLQKIYSTFPWARLKREGLPSPMVETFPYLQMCDLFITRYMQGWRWGHDHFGYANALLFDEWLDRRIPDSGAEALIALAGAGLKTGKQLQERGGIFICDRGSTHIRYGDQLHAEEHKRWGLQYSFDIRDTLREEAIYEAADAISVPSQFAARSYIESGISSDKVHVIPYGVRLDKFKPVGEPPKDTFEVLFVGQVSLRKGVPYLLEAFAQLKHPNKRLRIVGPYNPVIARVLATLPQDRVEYIGSVPQSRLAGYMSKSHVMVLPSIEDGFGMVMNQAMACGCPVIASDHCGAYDLITEGVDGFIVPFRDSSAIRERLQLLVDDPYLQGQMSEAALKNVQKLGGWNRYGDLWEDLLRKLIGGRAG